jgi:hypothetical protein
VKYVAWFIGICAGVSITLPALAQKPASFAVFDIEVVPDGVDLVVGIQPDAALALSGWQASNEDADISWLEGHADMLAAYIRSAVTLMQNGEPCTWEPRQEPLATDIVSLHADGVTFRGRVVCPDINQPFSLQTDLFEGMLSEHTNIVRLKVEDGYFRTLDELDASHDEAFITLSSMRTPSSDGAKFFAHGDLGVIVLGTILTTAIILGFRRARNRRLRPSRSTTTEAESDSHPR